MSEISEKKWSFVDLFVYEGMVDNERKLLPKIWNCAFALYFVISLFTFWYTVDKDENSVVQRFGKHVRTEEPGIHVKLPWPFEEATEVSVTKVKNIEIGFRTLDVGPPAEYQDIDEEALMLTGDANIVDLDFIVQFRSSDAAKWMFVLEDPLHALSMLSQSSMRYEVGRGSFDSVATSGRVTIQDNVHDLTSGLVSDLDFGVSIAGVQLQDAHPPEEVMHAFKDVTNAKEDKQKKVRSAEGYQNEILPQTRGKAKKMVEDALGFQAERIAIAQGDSSKFVDMLKEYKKLPGVTKDRMRLEVFGKILPGSKQWIILNGNGPLEFLDITNRKTDGR
ncbi:MAG: FtsH protease activity modulator HflK [Candidatus Kerfeldbacteria bacterium]